MELFLIPFEGHYIAYRPLLPLAFVCNRAMADCMRDMAHEGDTRGMTTDAGRFLADAGFHEPDAAAPHQCSLSPPAYRPSMAVLLMTTECNLRCTYCYANGGDGETLRMSPELARAAVDTVHANADAAGTGHFALAFHGGGEPTLHEDAMVEAILYARGKKLPCRISVTSNGVWSPRMRAFLLEQVDEVSLSFDGIPAVQNAQRPGADGTGSFRAVMETVRALDAAETSYGIRMTATDTSFRHLAESVAFLCRNTNCASLQVEPAYADCRGVYRDPTAGQVAAFAEAFIEGREAAKGFGRQLVYSGARPWLVTQTFCRAMHDAMVVTPPGDIVTCFEIYGMRHPLFDRFMIGHLSTEGPRVDDDRLRTLREREAASRTGCRQCFCYWHCAGDCMVRRMSSNGGKGGRCRTNRAITREILASYIAAGNGAWRGDPVQTECGDAISQDPFGQLGLP
jgi:uncharacterized protein